MKQQILAAALMFATAAPASAYTTYILPAEFVPRGEVEIQAAFASTFFTPQIALPADMQLTRPDGSQATFVRVAVNGPMTSLIANPTQFGTYRISTGERLGAVVRLVEHEGGWRQLAEGETPAEGLATTTLQTVTVADAYISRGEPTRQVVDTPHGTLALHPITHPNQVLVATGFEIELLFNGQPFPNMPLVLYDQGDADTNLETYFVTDERGRATLTFSQPGRYVVAVRHRGDAPEGSPAEVRSYTTTLTFEVLSALPADYEDPPVIEPERPRRRGLDRGR